MVHRLSAIKALLIVLVSAAPLLGSTFTVDYLFDGGGLNNAPLNGLAAKASFEINGTELTVLLENLSAGVPLGINARNSLLVSMGMNLPQGISIVSGDTAVIGPGSVGLGLWSSLGPGDSVADQWAWGNSGGGDLLASYAQVITTSRQNPGLTRFGGGPDGVGGPYGGIAADPPVLAIPADKKAVSDSIRFILTLSASLGSSQLAEVAAGSIVEFGNDARYLLVPEPGALSLIGLGAVYLAIFRRRRP